MSYVIPIMQTVNGGTATRIGDAVRMADGSMFVLDIDRTIANEFLEFWFDHVATFIPQAKESQMSDQTPSNEPTPPNRPESIQDVFDIAKGTVLGVGDGLRNEKTQEALGEIKQVSKSIFRSYRNEILYILIGLLFLRIYKRRVSRKAVKKTLKTLEAAGKVNSSNLQSILEELRAYPGQAVMDPSNGMVHLLKGKDTIVTVFGDFDRMSTEELWDAVANILNLGVKVDPRIAR